MPEVVKEKESIFKPMGKDGEKEEEENTKLNVKRKRSLKNLISKKDTSSTEQLEQLLSQNKHLQEQLFQVEQSNKSLKEKLIEKDQEIFVDQSNNVVLSSRTYNDLVNSTVERLSKDELCSFITSRFNLKVMSNTEYHVLNRAIDESYLKSEAAQLGFHLLERQEYDFMKSKMETPDVQTITTAATKMGLELLSSKELEHLRNPTRSEMEKKLKKMGLMVVSESNRNSIPEITSPTVPLSTTPSHDSPRNSGFYNLRNSSKTSLNSSRVLASRDFFEQVIKDENSNKDVVLEAGRSLGFVRLSQEQYKKLLDGQKEKILTKTDIYSGAKDFNLTVLPNEEYRQLLKNRKNRQSMTFDDLNEYARKFKLKLISTNAPVPDANEPSSPPSLSLRNSKIFSPIDSTPISSEKESPDGKTNIVFKNSHTTDLTFSDIESWCKKNNFRITKLSVNDEVENFVADTNSKLIPLQDYEDLLAKISGSSISVEKVKEYVQNNNLKLLPQKQFDDLKALKDGKTLKDYTKDEIKSYLTTLDPQLHITTIKIISSLDKELKDLKEKEITLTDVKEKFPELHFVTSEQLSSVKAAAKADVSLEDFIEKFTDHKILSNSDYDSLLTAVETASESSKKLISLNDIENEIKLNHQDHMLVEKKDFDSLQVQIKDLNQQTIDLEKHNNTKLTSIVEIEESLKLVDSNYIVVNKEEMFKALEDNTVTFEELLNIIQSQYPEFTLLSKEDYNSLNEKNNLGNDISVEQIKDIIANNCPEKTLVDVEEYASTMKVKTNSLEPKNIEEITNLIDLKYPQYIVLEKANYESQLKEFANELQHSRHLSDELEKFQNENSSLISIFDDLDQVKNIFVEKYPDHIIIDTHTYETLLHKSDILDKDIDQINGVLHPDHPDNIVVEKDKYESQLENLSNALKDKDSLSANVLSLQEENVTLSSDVAALSMIVSESKEKEKKLVSDTNLLTEKVAVLQNENLELLSLSNNLKETLSEVESKSLSSTIKGSELISVNELTKLVDEKYPDKLFVDRNDFEKILQLTHKSDHEIFVKLQDLVEEKFPDSIIDEKNANEGYPNSLNKNKNSFNATENAKMDIVENSIIEKTEKNTILTAASDPGSKLTANTSELNEDKTFADKTNSNEVLIPKSDLQSPSFIKANAEKIGLTVLTKQELTEIADHFTELGKQELKFDELEELVSTKFDSKIISKETFNNLNNQIDVDLDLLNQTAEDFGLALISNEELENLHEKSRRIDSELLNNQTENHVSSDISLEELGKVAKNHGLVIINKEEYEVYQNHDIQKEADKQGLKLIKIELYNELMQDKDLLIEINSTEIEHRTDDLDKESLFTFEQDRSKSLSVENFQEKFASLAAKNNMTVISTPAYKELLQSPILTKELLIQRARDFDMIAIDLQQFTDITKANIKQKETLPDLMMKLNDFGYVPVSNEEYEFLKNPTKDDIANLAYNQWNMVLVERNNSLVEKSGNISGSSSRITSHNRHNSLIQIQAPISRNFSANDAMQPDDSNGAYLFQPLKSARKKSVYNKPFNLLEEAKKQHMLLVPESIYLKDLHQIPPVSYGKENNGLLLVERAQLEKILNADLHYPEAVPPQELPESRSFENSTTQDIEPDTTNQTSEGFTNDKIIVSLTQTVIGEYLYKYYSKFGVFSKQRHERYFWIHPFTMTLYWSVTNPSKESNKNVLDNKTKGVSILGVEVVDDPNPYPPGLYHKSIVILTGDGKNVKITCPTLQRHKVWLRSLRYLQNAASTNQPGSYTGINKSMKTSRIPTSSSYSESRIASHNRTSSQNSFIVNERFGSTNYSTNNNNRLSPEVEQHPRFFVNSLK